MPFVLASTRATASAVVVTQWKQRSVDIPGVAVGVLARHTGATSGTL
jgi:hypothetical protein